MKSICLSILILFSIQMAIGQSVNDVVMKAVESGDLEILKETIKTNKESIDFKGINNTTPILQAGFNNRFDMAKTLAEAGASLVWKQKGGWTIFGLAIYQSNLEMINYLLGRPDCETYLNIVGHNGWTPISLAAAKGDLEVVKLIMKAKPKYKSKIGWEDSLFMAVNSGSVQTVSYLLPFYADVDINSLDESGYGIIHYYCMGSSFDAPKDWNKDEVLKILVARGLDVNKVSSSGEKWFAFTDERKDENLEEIILKYGGKR